RYSREDLCFLLAVYRSVMGRVCARARRQVCLLPRRGGFLERREASQARGARYGRDASDDQPGAAEDAVHLHAPHREPRDQLLDLPPRNNQSDAARPLAGCWPARGRTANVTAFLYSVCAIW